MASCNPRAPVVAADPPLAAKSAVAAADPTLSIPLARDLPLETFLLPRIFPLLRPPSLFGRLTDLDEADGGSAVALRLRRTSLSPGTVPAKALASSRSAVARPGMRWGAAAAAVVEVAGIPSIAASKSAFLRHKKASVAGSKAGKRKFAVPICVFETINALYVIAVGGRRQLEIKNLLFCIVILGYHRSTFAPRARCEKHVLTVVTPSAQAWCTRRSNVQRQKRMIVHGGLLLSVRLKCCTNAGLKHKTAAAMLQQHRQPR